MPKIHPFRALRYDPAKVGDLTKVTTQPYDKINPALRDEYYAKHEHNLIRVILRKDEPGKDKYQEAAKTLEDWVAKGVLIQDPKPALYAYHQTCKTPQGVKLRKGLSALVQIDEPGKGKILPHEQTHTGPKIDRFNLITATKAYTEQVFFLYSDPDKAVNALIDESTKRAPDLTATDDLGETHKVWRIDDPAKIAAIQKILEAKDCIIADGHHRYETSWNVKQDRLAKGAKLKDVESPANVLATLVNMDDELTIFGTHRLCYDVPGFNLEKLLRAAEGVFDVRDYPFSDGATEKEARKELLEDLRIEGLTKPCFGVAARDAKAHYLFVVRDVKAAAKKVKADRSEDWRSLDVCILHTLILEELLGVGPKQLADEKNVEFLRSADEAIEKARATKPYQVAFLVNPVRMEQIKRVVKNGEKFPQKATDFYPKLLTGLLLCKLNMD
jgi:uncharacterized protein (DUF1015 family)